MGAKTSPHLKAHRILLIKAKVLVQDIELLQSRISWLKMNLVNYESEQMAYQISCDQYKKILGLLVGDLFGERDIVELQKMSGE